MIIQGKGSYFVTICVKNRHEILGKIVGDAALGVPVVRLSDTGEMVRQYIENINRQNDVELDKYVIMPNHIHIIVKLKHPAEEGTPRAASPTKATIPKMVNALKGLTSKKFGESIWQRGYYDHIIRDEEDYQRIWRYIDENPERWAEDEYNNKES